MRLEVRDDGRVTQVSDSGGRNTCATGRSWAESGAGCGLTRRASGLACATAGAEQLLAAGPGQGVGGGGLLGWAEAEQKETARASGGLLLAGLARDDGLN
jgi:hypothetical protein